MILLCFFKYIDNFGSVFVVIENVIIIREGINKGICGTVFFQDIIKKKVNN